MKITDRVKTYEDACEILGIDPSKIMITYSDGISVNEANSIVAFAKLQTIAKALNEGWKPDWNNNDERKYYPWFDMEYYGDKSSSGVCFSYYDCYYDDSISNVSSRLVFKSRELAEYAGTQFLAEYRGFMVIE